MERMLHSEGVPPFAEHAKLMLLSVLSAVHSRELAAAIGYPRPEEAYLCGLVRNLGELLIGCHGL